MIGINPGAAAPISEFVEWDDEVVGLGRRWRTASAPRWIVQTRVEGRSRKRVIGDADAISIIDARLAARAMLDRIAEAAPDEAPDAPDPKASVSAFSRRWLEDLAPSWKPSTLTGHTHQVERQIVPALGDMEVRTLSKADVVRWRDGLDCAPATANRALAVLSGMMRHAELLGLIPAGSNPCKGLRRKETTFKAHYLTPAEYRRLERALERYGNEDPVAADLIRFIALTGCRRSEARLLQWSWIEGPAARLPDSKTGPTSIWLGEPARALLQRQERTGDFVFDGGDGLRPLGDNKLSDLWVKVRKAAKLKGLRVHDLRHSFASTAVTGGESLRTVSGLLGHKELETTEGYAHLGETEIRAAASRVGKVIAGKITQPKGKSLVPRMRARKQSKRTSAPAPLLSEQALRRAASPELRAFLSSGTSFKRFCAATDVDQEALSGELDTFRRKLAKLHRAAAKARALSAGASSTASLEQGEG